MARQGDLFSSSGALPPAPPPAGLPLLRHHLKTWQQRLQTHQAPLFASDLETMGTQGLLFEASPDDPVAVAARFNPLDLRPQALSFWRWPQAPHQGAALYFVMDRTEPDRTELDRPSAPLLLYVGETGKADQRWKGEHDCKSYLAAYQEALQRVGLGSQPSIRFWLDVPRASKPRRALEQALIRRWLPPFNKECRGRWATPFTAEPMQAN